MRLINEFNKIIRFRDIIDILIVAYLIYKLFTLIKETRAEQLSRGILTIFLFAKISGILKLYTINWILENTLTIGVIAILIVFQPELRRGLEYLGRTKFFSKGFLDLRTREDNSMVEQLVNAVASLSRQKIGGLIVIERETGLSDIVETGVKINGILTSELLINIFIPNTPLHDGAVIVKNDIIKAASCFLPLTKNQDISNELGTRHRAALGISEESDSITIIVSEEIGSISVAESGELSRHVDIKTLEEILTKLYDYNEVDDGLLAKYRGGYNGDE